MARRKLKLAKIEKMPSRQVTFSKRKNGLLKKSYELSVLCDVDVALIIFSETGKLTLFSGKKSIEEVFERFVSLPEAETGRVQNVELLRRTVENMRLDKRMFSLEKSFESQLKEAEFIHETCQVQLEELEKQLSIFEDPACPTSIIETMNSIKFLEHTLERIQQRREVLEDKYFEENIQPNLREYFALSRNERILSNEIRNCLELLPPYYDYVAPPSTIIVDSNGLVRMRYDAGILTEFSPMPSMLINRENEMNTAAYNNLNNRMMDVNGSSHGDSGPDNVDPNGKSADEDPTEQVHSDSMLPQLKH